MHLMEIQLVLEENNKKILSNALCFSIFIFTDDKYIKWYHFMHHFSHSSWNIN